MSPTSLADEIKKRHPFSSPAEEVCLNLIRTQSVLTCPVHHLFKEHGISHTKYNILRILRGSLGGGEYGPHGMPSLDIAERLITRVPDITRLVDGLVGDGYVMRTRCTMDRRVVYVGITDKGLALLHELDRPLEELHNAAMADMTVEELNQLNYLLDKLRQSVRACGEECVEET